PYAFCQLLISWPVHADFFKSMGHMKMGIADKAIGSTGLMDIRQRLAICRLHHASFLQVWFCAVQFLQKLAIKPFSLFPVMTQKHKGGARFNDRLWAGLRR